MIALFTDFGYRDAYVAQMKGVILSINPQAQLLDLTHQVTPFHIQEAAYLLEQATRYLPAGTATVAVVDPGVGTSRRPILVLTEAAKYYVGPDNGLFSWVIEREGLVQCIVLQAAAYFRCPEASSTFHGRDIFAPVAAYLTLGIAPEHFGPSTTDLVRLPCPQAEIQNGTVRGMILHVDHFGNVVTNIEARLLPGLRAGQPVRLWLAEEQRTIPFYPTYGAAPPGTLMCLINSDARLELALPQGAAVHHLSVHVGDAVVVAL
jgi:hypothetical protein